MCMCYSGRMHVSLVTCLADSWSLSVVDHFNKELDFSKMKYKSCYSTSILLKSDCPCDK